MVIGFELGRRDVAQRLHQSVVVEPRYPFRSREFYGLFLGATDSMAAYSDGYSPRCSCTILTALSRTSGENLFDLLMAQSSQCVEPPRNQGQFTS